MHIVEVQYVMCSTNNILMNCSFNRWCVRLLCFTLTCSFNRWCVSLLCYTLSCSFNRWCVSLLCFTLSWPTTGWRRQVSMTKVSWRNYFFIDLKEQCHRLPLSPYFGTQNECWSPPSQLHIAVRNEVLCSHVCKCFIFVFPV